MGRRVLRHHVPLGFGSAAVLVLFMSLPLFDISLYPHPDIVSGRFPQQRAGSHNGLMAHGRDHATTMGHGRDVTGARDHGGSGAGSMDHGGEVALSRSVQQFTVATGYLALGFLALTLLLGPANLVLRRRNPVSTYLRRDVGIWTAIFSVVHVTGAVLIHVSHDTGLVASFVHFFVAEDGTPLTNSFGLGNWTGLAALIIGLGLLATSSDAALRKLKAGRWKWVQRLTYPLFALVILHAFFYGALMRMTSPFTLILGLSVIVVFVGQVAGIWLWRQKYSHT